MATAQRYPGPFTPSDLAAGHQRVVTAPTTLPRAVWLTRRRVGEVKYTYPYIVMSEEFWLDSSDPSNIYSSRGGKTSSAVLLSNTFSIQRSLLRPFQPRDALCRFRGQSKLPSLYRITLLRQWDVEVETQKGLGEVIAEHIRSSRNIPFTSRAGRNAPFPKKLYHGVVRRNKAST